MRRLIKVISSSVGLFVLACVVGQALLSPSAMAQDREKGMTPIPGSGAQKKYGYMVLMPADLKKCVDLGNEMSSLQGEIDTSDKKVRSGQAEMKALKDAMDKKQAAASSGGVALVEYNKSVDAFNNRNAAYSKDVESFKKSIDRLNRVTEDYKRECAGRQFYQEDYDQLFGSAGR